MQKILQKSLRAEARGFGILPCLLTTAYWLLFSREGGDFWAFLARGDIIEIL
jgi:hypothetical protein